MSNRAHNHVTDLRGLGRMAIDATTGLTDLVEALQSRIARTPAALGGPLIEGAVHGISGLVYRSIRGVTRVVGGGIDAVLEQLSPLLGQMESPPAREALVAALNGVLGDYLAETRNPLAIEMSLRRGGRSLVLSRSALAAELGPAPARLLVLVHGLCLSDLQWRRDGHDHGTALARDLGGAAVYLHYNSGLHVSVNGRAFADHLEALAKAWPGDYDLLAHSMGGLVARSALHYGVASGHAWPKRLRKLVFLGTPHHGAPLERGGHWIETLLSVSGYSAPFVRLGRVRSAGITDLRHGCLLDEDWMGRSRFAHGLDARTPVPLPDGVASYAIAAHLGKHSDDLKEHLLGDGLVPIASALGHHVDPRLALGIPEERSWIAHQTGHLDLLCKPAVYAQLRAWLANRNPQGDAGAARTRTRGN